MLNSKKVSLANAAAVCLTAVPSASTQFFNDGSNSYTMLITYTTQDEHNFYPGARVNITGFSVSSSIGPTSVSANFTNATVFAIVDSKTFTILNDAWSWSNTAGYTFTGPGKAYLSSAALSGVDLVYGYPNLSSYWFVA
jgi:hypothetical protein